MKRKKRKKSNSVKIALTIFVVILAIYLISYYSNKPVEKPIETESPSEIPKPTPEIPITTTIEKQKPTKFISDSKCVSGNIMMTFTNILKKPKKISDFTFLIAGRANRNPQCELTELEPGESTFCQNLNGNLRFRKKVLIGIGYPAHYENTVVDCRTPRITANIVKDIKNFLIKIFGIS